ncbi:IS3 family transposase ISRso11 [Carnimonas sp. R-84865]
MARSTWYYQTSRLKAADKYEELKTRIRALYTLHRGCYGYRRMTQALCNEGCHVNHKLVHRLMKSMNMGAVIRRRKRYNAYMGDVGKASENILKRKFRADRPSQKLATDVTEFKVTGQKLYLSPVIDMFNGEIIAWNSATQPTLPLVGHMLKKLKKRLKPNDTPLLHSDQGITQSMSRKGNCLDNACIESFFGTLKEECYRQQTFNTIDELKAAIDRYIHYYNHERIKGTLKGLSPVQYRTQPLGSPA